MNWEAVGAIAELAGAVAVVVTLAYLAKQITQNTNIMKAQAYQARSDALMDLTMRVGESENLSSISSKIFTTDDGEPKMNEEAIASLSPQEFSQFRFYLTAHLHRMDNLLKQYELGFLDQDYFDRGIARSARNFWIPMWRKFDVFLAEDFIQRLSKHTDGT